MIDTQKLRQRILNLAIRGKLIPQDPNDEPASVLLDRIRTEKERLIAEGKIKRPKASKKTTDTPHYPDFTPPFNIPASWQWVKLEDFVQRVTDFVASGSFSSLRENVAYYNEENYAVLVRTADFQTKFTQGLVYTDKHGYEFLSNSNLFGGELILPNIGASIGKVFIVPNLNKPMSLAPNSIMVKSWDDYKRDWLYFLFQSEFGQYLLQSINNSSAQGKFNKTDFKGLMIPIPGQHEMRKILIAINTFSLLIENINSNKSKLIAAVKQTRTKILELAVAGKLVPQNPDDEPASELLKRINPKAEIITDNGHYPQLPKGWCVCRLEDIVDFEQPQKYIVSSTDYSDEYATPVLTAGKSFIIGYTDETFGVYNALPVIIFDDFTTESKFVDFPFKVKSSAMKILTVKKSVIPQFVHAFMRITHMIGDTHKRYWISEYSKLQIMLPPLNEQERIVQSVRMIESTLDDIKSLLESD